MINFSLVGLDMAFGYYSSILRISRWEVAIGFLF
jgi:hypothetical protein